MTNITVQLSIWPAISTYQLKASDIIHVGGGVLRNYLAEPIPPQYKPHQVASALKTHVDHGHIAIDSIRGTIHMG